MVVIGLSISETADLLGFLQKQPSLEFTENGLEKTNHPVNCSCVDKNVLLMSEENEQTGSKL